MAEKSLLLEKKEQVLGEKEESAGQKKEELHMLSLLTYRPVGNPLANAPPKERRVFFDSLSQSVKNEAPLQRIIPHPVLRATDSERAKALAANFEVVQKQVDLQKGAAQQAAAQEKQRVQLQYVKPENTAASDGQMQASKSMSQQMRACMEQLSFVLGDFSRGNPQKTYSAVSEFESRLEAQNYKADDLMSVLLLVIEDKIWGGEEGQTGGAKRFGGRISSNKVPLELRQTAKESAYVRLASVREMLRYYFERNPKDYVGALTLALGITADEGADQTFMQERLAYELAMIGSFALAQKLLAAVKLQRKMNTQKCLLELGYRYDIRRKKLVLGKRTCGTPSESRGIVHLIISAAKK